ncbi:hypothetical protein Mapa_010925 [Marchantia paleacea]|nr:hypothetical protein Mapa_010925 [Marchantia paleacea]
MKIRFWKLFSVQREDHYGAGVDEIARSRATRSRPASNGFTDRKIPFAPMDCRDKPKSRTQGSRSGSHYLLCKRRSSQ